MRLASVCTGGLILAAAGVLVAKNPTEAGELMVGLVRKL